MASTKETRIKLDISYANGVWEVVIFIGDQTEHRSFGTEREAREFGAARIEQLRLGKPKTGTDGAAA